MKKQWIMATIIFLLSAYFLRGIYIEKKRYLDSARDCSVYKNSDREQFLGCWRAQRKANYSLRKRIGYYEKKLVGGDS